MSTTDKIIRALEAADKATAALVPVVERVTGFLGKATGARWHRWRNFRLRLRAARIESGRRRPFLDAARRVQIVADLRRQAAEHLLQSLGPAGVDDSYLHDLAALRAGDEPKAGRT